MTTETICQGEDFSLLFAALADEADTQEDVSGCDFELLLYTSAYGSGVLASTRGTARLAIERKDVSTLFVNIPAEVTASFTAGPLRMEMLKIDRKTGAREIAQKIVMQVEESKIGRL